ncbi:uncharacterized protein LY89DRAFT_729156 [Mollisia scopiformis]|uniref:Uncharacterized protein n=1 Tax=Mollisia scopiformis TaxID=149040 RepID=A0A194XN94_MOLSC|nr:uncharacterized protein LY89DRAFT_729156 [Mollisia scopiformis]KUJ21643.1 hypothetical protein LY89DRAFT_729156 [Mollisia scopiformis]
MDQKEMNLELKSQVIDRSYVDQKKLVQKLKNRYGQGPDGKNNFKIQLRLNRYTIMFPANAETLTEGEINEVCLV